MAFILTELIVLLIIIGLFLLLSGVWPPDSPWAPWWQMPEDVVRKMCKIAKISSKDTIYDLGCGTGKALCIAAKEYGAKGVGVEIDPLRVWLAKWNVWKLKKHQNNVDITILKKNFFDVNISQATVIFVYLVPKALTALSKKFFEELKPGTLLISYVYDFPEIAYKEKLKLIHHDSSKKIYVYRLLDA